MPQEAGLSKMWSKMQPSSQESLTPSELSSESSNDGGRATRMRAWLLVFGAVAGLMAVPCARPVHAASRQTREAGAALFHKTGCEFCHGVNGVGTERAPDLSTVGKRKKRPQLEQQILHGGNGMPPFDEVLQPDEVKLLVDYLSSKRKTAR
jgi:mono/diheme cytochrome c family protein